MKNSNSSVKAVFNASAKASCSEAVALHNRKMESVNAIESIVFQACSSFCEELRDLINFTLDGEAIDLNVIKSLLFEEIARIDTLIACSMFLVQEAEE